MPSMQLNLFASERRQLIVVPCDPNGPTCSDNEIVEAIKLTDKRVTVRIELARYGEFWMFSTSLDHPNGGYCYRVGSKWGVWARSRDDAMFFAIHELLKHADKGHNVKKEVTRLLARLPESYLLEYAA